MTTPNYGLVAPDTINANAIGWLNDIRDDLIKLDAAYKANTSLTADPTQVPGAVTGSYTGTLIQLLSRLVNRVETIAGRTWNLQPVFMSGTGDPEGVKTAPVGTYYIRTDATSAAGARWYKLTGSGNTGWKKAGMAIKSIQRGTISVSGNSATATITSVDVTKSEIFLLGTSFNGGGNADFPTRVDLTNATTVTATRNSGAAGTVVLGYQVTEWEQ